MEWYEILGLVVLVAFILIVAIVIINALLFKDKTDLYKNVPFLYEDDDIVYKLGELIKIPTVFF